MKSGSIVKLKARQARRRRRRMILAGLLLLAAAAAFLFWGAPGCSQGTELSSSSGMAGGSVERQPRLELMEVDEVLSQQAQAGSLKLSALPPGKLCVFRQLRDSAGNRLRDSAGRLLRTPWVVTAPPLLDRAGVERVTNPGSDAQGRPLISIDFTTEGAAQLSERLSAARGGDKPQRLAIVIGGEVRSVLDASDAVDSGTLEFCGIPAPEAIDIAAEFAAFAP